MTFLKPAFTHVDALEKSRWNRGMSDTEQNLQPCLAELLRTCIRPDSMVLQVDKMVTQETTGDSGNRSPSAKLSRTVTRLHLTDGELCIQALLQPILLAHYDLNVGDRIEVRDFVVRKAKRLNGSGKIIYLGIQAFAILNQHKSEDWDGEGGFVKSEEEEPFEPSPKRRKRNTNRVAFTGLPDPSDGSEKAKEVLTPRREAPLKPSRDGNMVADEDADSEDDFESLNVNFSQAQQRRQTLHVIQQASATTASSNADSQKPESPAKPQHEPEKLRPSTYLSPQAPPPNTANPPTTLPPSLPLHNPPPLTTPYAPLSLLLCPHLPSRNYPLTTLAIITYTSPTLLSKPNSPFPPKRNIRLLDPSLSHSPTHPQGLTLAVYVDAPTFLPQPGTIALFRGIVMQRFGREVILNAYQTLKDKPENEKWFVDNERTLEGMGFDVKGMRRWWDERVSKNAKKSVAS